MKGCNANQFISFQYIGPEANRKFKVYNEHLLEVDLLNLKKNEMIHKFGTENHCHFTFKSSGSIYQKLINADSGSPDVLSYYQHTA